MEIPINRECRTPEVTKGLIFNVSKSKENFGFEGQSLLPLDECLVHDIHLMEAEIMTRVCLRRKFKPKLVDLILWTKQNTHFIKPTGFIFFVYQP